MLFRKLESEDKNMKQKLSLVLTFIKDKIFLFAVFIVNTAALILFFNLSLNSSEWFYPGLISVFIFLPYIGSQYIAYRKLILLCDAGETNQPDEFYTNNEYIKKVNSTLINLHKSYNIRLSEEQQKNLDFRRFISQFVHAMKTPVTVINLAVQKSKEFECKEAADCKLNNVIADISEENNRQLGMLNNLLDYLRINEFSKDYTPVTVDLNHELIALINSKKRSFIYGNVRPNLIGFNSEGCMVLTDIKWNLVMLDQIISNSIKYSGAKSDMKRIDFVITCDEEKTCLSIRDYGIGIPPQDISRVTEPFFTGQNGRSMKNATGIGLYIVKLIAEGLGHKLEIESKPDEGTTVSVTYYNLKSY